MKKAATLAALVLFMAGGVSDLFALSAGAQPENAAAPIAVMDAAQAKTLLENQRAALAETLGSKKADRLVNRLSKAIDKAEAKSAKPETEAERKMAEKLAKKIKKAEAAKANMQLVRIGAILAIAGLIVWLLVSSLIGGIVLAVGLILLLIGLI